MTVCSSFSIASKQSPGSHSEDLYGAQPPGPQVSSSGCWLLLVIRIFLLPVWVCCSWFSAVAASCAQIPRLHMPGLQGAPAGDGSPAPLPIRHPRKSSLGGFITEGHYRSHLISHPSPNGLAILCPAEESGSGDEQCCLAVPAHYHPACISTGLVRLSATSVMGFISEKLHSSLAPHPRREWPWHRRISN